MDRFKFSLLSERGELTPLYDRSTNERSQVLRTTEWEAMIETEKETAAKKFVAFVGDDAKALAISKVMNQQLIFATLTRVTKTTDGPLQLLNHGGGEPIGPVSIAYTLLKSPEDNLIIRVNTQQKPRFFLPAGKTDQIELDSQKSFVNFYYDLTCHFDAEGNLSIMPGPINCNYHLEQGSNGLG
ncbi:MAG: hypothetical protein NT164_06865 [Verrucomicrobiae bacterium]|nr:hypothetical protein [Verrucomicrobiae bacterium]